MTGKEIQWLIVGLQNPGRKYERTRHNLGGRVVEAFRDTQGLPPFRRRSDLSARVSKNNAVILAVPTTFMNACGRAVAALVDRFSAPLDHFLLVHDDKDLAFGEIKLQHGRGSAGHHGVQSVMDTVASQEFWRLRIGIGSPSSGIDTDTYVLAPFSPDEEEELQTKVIPNACNDLKSASRD